ncbi:YggS family pyridoxal phosphate-dependent enzyme [Rhodoplanes serenus]|uniref:Pyridoxal phosphate homeostasis protein n=1 Tax=Rhodoplanes serenus TaxID=200615 RepID=A0A9X4XJ02_9BRAD|nr:YggS family pyridoxal phosphate-dependent enzyme [Rhodoplanes serenus]MTW15930.1 YggS family pyridoxal phosphate-dependent enzyme [Rhodoplanes serenus]
MTNPDHRASDTAAETAGAAARLAAVRAEVEAACREAGRDPGAVTLVAVSKTVPAAVIEPVIAAGQRAFGENRVQEAKAKWGELRERHPGVALHMIGPLQSNKTREAVALFDAIHSLDRPSLAAALAKEVQRAGRQPLLFVEINTGAEPQKAGVLPEQADAFVAACRTTYGLTVAGLMCIPPADEAPAPHFALTAKIAARNGLELLSMGMSDDFAVAIRFGATHVRVGTAIFGERPAPVPAPAASRR